MALAWLIAERFKATAFGKIPIPTHGARKGFAWALAHAAGCETAQA
ncbi:MAG: hypothetical protein Aurels2KO_02270 [Aureliella sp.]